MINMLIDKKIEKIINTIIDSYKHPLHPFHFAYLVLFKRITGKLKKTNEEADPERLIFLRIINLRMCFFSLLSFKKITKRVLLLYIEFYAL